MAVRCDHCGEELLGAVNRCWKCGRTYSPAAMEEMSRAAQQGELEPANPAIGQPPGERIDPSPAESEAAPVVARAIDEEAIDVEAIDEEGASLAVADAVDRAKVAEWASHEYFVGSPFAEEPILSNAPRIPQYPRHVAAEGGAAASLVLGLLSFGICFLIPLGAIITSLVGLAMGVWGAYSRRRGLAVVGMSLCCLALAIASFWQTVEIYTHVTGASPFAPPLNAPDNLAP